MILLFASLIALAAAGQPAAPPAQGPTQCRGNDKAVAAWVNAQGRTNNYFSDTYDHWGYTNNVLAASGSSFLFYFALPDYMCKETPLALGCSSQVQSIQQRCNSDGSIDISVALQIRNANTWVSVLSYDYINSQPDPQFPNANIPIYGCRLNTNRVPSTLYQPQACATDPQWQQHLALSDGTWSFTYRLKGATCTCNNPALTTNYAYDAVTPVSATFIAPWDNDVRLHGSGFFNNVTGTGIYQDVTGAAVAGTHTIHQTTSGAPVNCTGSDGTPCWLTEHGSANIKLMPQGGGNMDLFELRKFLNSLFLKPAYSPYTNPHSQAKKSAPLRQAASKK